MVLKRLPFLFKILTIIFLLLNSIIYAQEVKPLLVGAESLQATYPGNFGVSYTESKAFAQALGLSYWEDDSRLILGLGSLQIRLPLSNTPKSRTILKKFITSNPPHALKQDGKTLIPVRFVAKSLGCSYSGSQSSLRVFLPEASITKIAINTLNKRDVLSIKFNRNVNFVKKAPGHWIMLGVRAKEEMRYVNGIYISDIRLSPSTFGSEIQIDGVSGWPEEIAYYPQEVRIYVGQSTNKKSPPPLIVIDPGHGGEDLGASYGNLTEKSITLNIALSTANILKKQGYNVVLTRNKDIFKNIYERAQAASQADVFISLHVAGSPLAPPGPNIYLSQNTTATPVFTIKSHMLLANNSNKLILRNYAVSLSELNNFVFDLEAQLGKLGLTARRGQQPIYLLERAPGAALLFEIGAIYNHNDRARMKNKNQQLAYSQAIANAIMNFLGGSK